MNKLLLLALSLYSICCFSEEISCFNSKGVMMYHHKVNNIKSIDNVTIFTENNTKQIIFTNLDCVIKA